MPVSVSERISIRHLKPLPDGRGSVLDALAGPEPNTQTVHFNRSVLRSEMGIKISHAL